MSERIAGIEPIEIESIAGYEREAFALLAKRLTNVRFDADCLNLGQDGFVARIDDDVVGALVFQLISGKGPRPQLPPGDGRRGLLILYMAVDERWERRGIGRALLARVDGVLAPGGRVFGGCADHEVGFYKRAGYTVLGADERMCWPPGESPRNPGPATRTGSFATWSQIESRFSVRSMAAPTARCRGRHGSNALPVLGAKAERPAVRLLSEPKRPSTHAESLPRAPSAFCQGLSRLGVRMRDGRAGRRP